MITPAINLVIPFEQVKENIIMIIVGKNHDENLSTIAHINYLDLTVIFHMVVNTKEKMESCAIYNRHMEYWGVTTEDLLELAKVNTPRILGLRLNGIGHTIGVYSGDGEDKNAMEDWDELDDELETPMLVGTNNFKTLGASVILYPQLFEAIASKLKVQKIYIIPCSIHELIFVPYKKGMVIDDMVEMIRYVNRTELKPSEVLSDSLYIYNYKTNEVKIA